MHDLNFTRTELENLSLTEIQMRPVAVLEDLMALHNEVARLTNENTRMSWTINPESRGR